MAKITDRNYPIVILVRGMPGSGKSYVAEALQKKVEAQTGKGGVVVLDIDATNYDSPEYKAHVETQTAEGVDPKLHAYRFLRQQAYDGIEAKKIIIWNQGFSNIEIFNKMISRLRDHAYLHHVDLPILVVEVVIDPAVAKARILQRQRAANYGDGDEKLAEKLNNYKFQSFAGEGYDTVTVRGEDEVSKSVSAVLKSLEDAT